jgi:hypothetical protein
MLRSAAVFGLLCLGLSACDSCNRGSASGADSATVRPAEEHVLAADSRAPLLSDDHPTDSIRIELGLRYDGPGVVLDSADPRAPETGDLRLLVLADGTLELRLYAPKRKSSLRDDDGWHVLSSDGTVSRGRGVAVVIELFEGDLALWLDGKLEVRKTLKTRLSGEPLYLGARPAKRGATDADSSMTGTVDVTYLGPLKAKTYVKRRGLEL